MWFPYPMRRLSAMGAHVHSGFRRPRPCGPAVRPLAPLIGGLLLLSCGVQSPLAPPPERIVLIVVDTLRRDHVSAYGGAVETPNIDRLAAGGQVFEQALSNFHSTTMSMASLMSGRTPSIESGDRAESLEWNTFASCGLSRFAAVDGSDACVPGSIETLAENLRAAGYETAGVVSNDLLYRPYGFEQGFDKWVEVPRLVVSTEGSDGEPRRAMAEISLVNRAVDQILETRRSDRFFLYVHYIDVHDWHFYGISYAEAVRVFDRHLGALLDRLEGEGLLEDAVVLLTSDHGEMLVDSHLGYETLTHFGNPSWEPLLQVPLIVSAPTERDGAVLIRSQDVKGLIEELAGLEPETASELEPDELLTTERFYQTYRKGQWKSIWRRGRDDVLLFDLAADPGEQRDLAAMGYTMSYTPSGWG